MENNAHTQEITEKKIKIEETTEWKWMRQYDADSVRKKKR